MSGFEPHSTKPRRAFIAFAAALALIPAALAQDKPVPSNTAPPDSANPANPTAFSYEVVSIKLYKQSDAGMSMWWRTTKDGFSTKGSSLMSLLFNSFPIVIEEQIVGLPSWAKSEYYDVDAKMDDETVAAFDKLSRDQKNQIRNTMMQAALADRFQLKFHKETREMPIYNIVIAKGGLKIQPTPDGKDTGYSMGMGKLSGNGIPLDSLAFSLSGQVGRMIVNKTGLTGKYNFDLKWQPDSMQAGSAATNTDALPDLFTALEEQLGLKLESAKGPVDVYVIDHVEKPSEN